MDKQNQEIFNVQWVLSEINKLTKEELISNLEKACDLIDELREERNKYKKKVMSIKIIMESANGNINERL